MEKDSLRRFMLTNTQVRGEWVHLDTTWQSLLVNGDYPQPVKKILGEALAAVLLLSATIKYEGSLILQIKATGPMHLLVVCQLPRNRKKRGAIQMYVLRTNI